MLFVWLAVVMTEASSLTQLSRSAKAPMEIERSSEQGKKSEKNKGENINNLIKLT